MFSFFKKKEDSIPKAPLLTVDIHSHLIPGIDDGAKTMDESILLLKGLEALGYKKVITTPHIMIDAYGNTKTSILRELKGLQEEALKQGLKVEINAAAEYYLDEGLLPLIKNKDVLLIANKYLLFETSYVQRPQQLETIIFEILANGFIPLLAHPERYRYMKNNIEDYITLKNLGVKFQVNLNSFNGHYGNHAQKQAFLLSKNGLIDFLGSDTHHNKHVKNLTSVFAEEVYNKIYQYNKIQNNML